MTARIILGCLALGAFIGLCLGLCLIVGMA